MARSKLAASVTGVLLAVGLVVSVSAAAQPKQQPEPQRHFVREVVPFEVANPGDGVTLRGHVYLPDTPTGQQVGTVLNLSPYWSNTGQLANPNGTLRSLWDWFLSDGYAFAAVNLRGTGNSGGCMNFGGLPDQADAYEVVEGLAAQPWSNGKIGMFGGSYEGWTQSMAVAAQPPHLAAIVPVSSITDYWNLVTFNGAPLAGGAIALWPTLVVNSNNPTSCPELASHGVENESAALDVDRGPYFQERYYLDDFARSDVPVFVTNGLRKLRLWDYDTAIEGEGHILQIEGLWEHLPPGNRRMFIGNWSHGYPAPLGMSAGEARAMFRKMLSEWYAAYLQDDSAPGRRVGQRQGGGFDEVIYQDDQGAFHTVANWPPDPEMTGLPLSGGVLLSPGANPATGARLFQSGERGGVPVAPDPGPDNCGPTQLVYTSAPLSREVHLAGNFVAELTVESTLPGGNLVATLFAMPTSQPRLEVLPAEDLCSTPGVRELGRAITSLRQWQYTGVGENFPVLEPTKVPLKSVPFATTVRPGERLVLVVAAHHSTVQGSPYRPLLTVHTGPSDGSSLLLPVVSGELRLVGSGG